MKAMVQITVKALYIDILSPALKQQKLTLLLWREYIYIYTQTPNSKNQIRKTGLKVIQHYCHLWSTFQKILSLYFGRLEVFKELKMLEGAMIINPSTSSVCHQGNYIEEIQRI